MFGLTFLYLMACQHVFGHLRTDAVCGEFAAKFIVLQFNECFVMGLITRVGELRIGELRTGCFAYRSVCDCANLRIANFAFG
jgi:hypothetical protein